MTEQGAGRAQGGWRAQDAQDPHAEYGPVRCLRTGAMTENGAGRAQSVVGGGWREQDPQAAAWQIVGYAGQSRDAEAPVGFSDALVACAMCRQWCHLYAAVDRMAGEANAPMCRQCHLTCTAESRVLVNSIVTGRGALRFVVPLAIEGDELEGNRSEAFRVQQSRACETWCGCSVEDIFDGACECKYSTELGTAVEAAAQARTDAYNLHRLVASDDEANEDVWGLGAFLASEGLGY